MHCSTGNECGNMHCATLCGMSRFLNLKLEPKPVAGLLTKQFTSATTDKMYLYAICFCAVSLWKIEEETSCTLFIWPRIVSLCVHACYCICICICIYLVFSIFCHLLFCCPQLCHALQYARPLFAQGQCREPLGWMSLGLGLGRALRTPRVPTLVFALNAFEHHQNCRFDVASTNSGAEANWVNGTNVMQAPVAPATARLNQIVHKGWKHVHFVRVLPYAICPT